LREFLEKNYEDGMTEEGCIKLAVQALLEVVDSGAKNMEICVIRRRTGEEHGTAKRGSTGIGVTMDEDDVAKIVKEIEDEAEEGKTGKGSGGSGGSGSSASAIAAISGDE